MKLNLPNMLTLFRIFLIPIFFILFYLPTSWSYVATAIVFALAAATDWLDGFIARTFDQTSEFGEFLDPVADKLIVAAALVLLVSEHGTPWLAIPAVIIVCREIVISALREWMAEIGKRASVKVNYLGKIKTAVQMVAIFLLLLQPPTPVNAFIIIGYILVYTAAILTLWSMFNYLQLAYKDFAEEEQQL